MRLRYVWSCVAALALLCPGPAVAQGEDREAEDAKRPARDIANEGYKLFQQGEYEAAIEAFAEANRRFHAPTIEFMMGQAHEKLGHLVEASAMYGKIADEELGPRASREFQNAQRRAVARFAALVGRIPTLRLAITGAPPGSAQITIDDLPVTLPADGQPLRQNPGRHTIVVTASGCDPATRSVMLVEGDKQQLAIELSPAGAAHKPTEAPPPEVYRQLPEPPPHRSSSGSSAGAIGSFILGGLGIGAGAVSGIIAYSKAQSLASICRPPRCKGASPAQYRQAQVLHDDASTASTIATVSFIVGGVATAAGVTFLLTQRSPNPQRTQAAVLISPGWVGLSGSF